MSLKSKNDTWLGFFKKTLKVSGIIILGLIIAIVIFIYIAATHDSKTYLECTRSDDNKISYLAFNDYKLFMNWDELNEKFKYSYKIEEINKKFIKAYAYANINDDDTLTLSKNNVAKVVKKMIWEIDRETGFVKAYFENDTETKVRDDRICKKISKRNLPKKKVQQKF